MRESEALEWKLKWLTAIDDTKFKTDKTREPIKAK